MNIGTGYCYSSVKYRAFAAVLAMVIIWFLDLTNSYLQTLFDGLKVLVVEIVIFIWSGRYKNMSLKTKGTIAQYRV